MEIKINGNINEGISVKVVQDAQSAAQGSQSAHNAWGNEYQSINCGNEPLIDSSTTLSELLKILSSRPEAAKATEVEQEEKVREEKEARLRDILGEDYDTYMEPTEKTQGPLVKEKRRPGAVKLRTTVPCIGRIEIGGDGICEAFSNGYAVYDNGDRKTVLWIPDCGSVTYYFGKLRDNEKEYLREKDEIGEDILSSLPWYHAVVIAGENQIERNLIHPKSVGVASDSDDPEEWELKSAYRWSCGSHFDNPEEAYIKKEEAEERRRALTEKQREAYVLYYEEGYTEEEIAELLCISRRSVRDRLSETKKKFEKEREKFLS